MRDPSDLAGVPAELLAAYGLPPGKAFASSYRCSDPTAQKIPISGISYPQAKALDRDAVVRVLVNLRQQRDVDPIIVCRRPEAFDFTLVEGLHRLAVSVALGYVTIPATLIPYDIAKPLL
jgi:hypothetical protein